MSVTSTRHSDREVRAELDDKGWVQLGPLLGAEELGHLREASAQAIASTGASREEDYQREPDEETGLDVLYRILFTTDKPAIGEPTLALMAHPTLRRWAEALLGDDYVTTVSEVLVKQPECGRPLALHRDTTPLERFPDDHKYLIAGVYLDDATVDDGCLRALPGSHRLPDVTDLLELPFDHPDLVPLEARAGDLVLHDCRVLHGSPPNRSPALRRTVYFEYHSAAFVVRDGVRPEIQVGPEYAGRRMRLLQEACAVRAARFPDERAEPYRPPEEWRPHVPAGTDRRAAVPFPPFF